MMENVETYRVFTQRKQGHGTAIGQVDTQQRAVAQ